MDDLDEETGIIRKSIKHQQQSKQHSNSGVPKKKKRKNENGVKDEQGQEEGNKKKKKKLKGSKGSRKETAEKRKLRALASRKCRHWVKRWVQRRLFDGKKTHVLCWVSDEKPNMSEPSQDASSTPRTHACNKCQKTFADASGLRKHAKIHGEKLFVCQVAGCEKRFIDRSKLKRHQLVHTGERPFPCPYPNCNRRFSLDFNLKSHLRLHTGVKPFKCEFLNCGKKFAQVSNLRAHKKTHLKNRSKKSPDGQGDVMGDGVDMGLGWDDGMDPIDEGSGHMGGVGVGVGGVGVMGNMGYNPSVAPLGSVYIPGMTLGGGLGGLTMGYGGGGAAAMQMQPMFAHMPLGRLPPYGMDLAMGVGQQQHPQALIQMPTDPTMAFGMPQAMR